MKTLKLYQAILVLLSLFTLIQLSCSDDLNLESVKNTDFDIYIAKEFVYYNHLVDYSDIDLDTVSLQETPFLTMSDIESYDTVNHIINLKESKYHFDYPSSGVFGQMFVVCVDKKPVYCGFYWSNMSSVTCNWIFIEEPNEYNGLTENQIKINAGYPNDSYFQSADPRKNSLIINAFSKYNKLTGNTCVQGYGLNFYSVILSSGNIYLDDIAINSLDLKTEPFISYTEILTYDTAYHIMELTISQETVYDRADEMLFVASLDNQRKYFGSLVPPCSSNTYPTITLISDNLPSNQIKIGLGRPEYLYEGQDLRLSNNILERLKQDNKIK